MNWMRFIVFFLCCSILACSESTTTNGVARQDNFFDLSEYFKQQATQLAAQSAIQKTAAINGKTESQTITNPDFQQELQLFMDSDINRPSWLDKYAVDSTINAAGELTALSYTAQEERLRTRKVDIAFANNMVTNIEIINATDNVIAQTKQELSYQPQQGYTIKSFQDILFAEPRTMEIKVLL